MLDTAYRPTKKPRKTREKAASQATIRCSDCGGDFKTAAAFDGHNCDQQPFNFDYIVGSNL